MNLPINIHEHIIIINLKTKTVVQSIQIPTVVQLMMPTEARMEASVVQLKIADVQILIQIMTNVRSK